MFKKIFILFSCFALGLFLFNCKKSSNDGLKGTITISGAWALYPLAVKWAEEYKAVRPKVNIDISAGGAGKGMADALSGIVDIGMVSRDIYEEEIKKGARGLAVAKDAVVPVCNIKNPLIKEISSKGLTSKNFADIWITGKAKTWDMFFGRQENIKINVFTRSDACGAGQTWAEFLGKDQEDLGGIGVYGDPGIADAVKKDPLGIGYGNVNYVYDAHSKKPSEGLLVIPIDINGNGVIDKDEDFYGTRDGLAKAIADGRYPSPPARLLYFVVKNTAENALVTDFLKWCLTEGRAFVEEAGYINTKEEIQKEELKELE